MKSINLRLNPTSEKIQYLLTIRIKIKYVLFLNLLQFKKILN